MKTMTAPTAIVKRDGIYKNIPASQVVKGDLVKVKAGNQVPATVRLIRSQGISLNESALTGESLPVAKITSVLKQELPMAEKKNTLLHVNGNHERKRRRDCHSYRDEHRNRKNCRYAS